MTDTNKTGRTRRFARTPKNDGSAVDRAPEAPDAAAPVQPSAEKTAKPASKIAEVIALLTRQEGATLAEMIEATGWLPHTTRAALTGLKKKGHTIERSKRGDVTSYCIASEA
jgi:hypothetical protein